MDKSESKLLIRPIKKITSEHYKLFLEADPSRKIIDSYLNRAHKFELVNDTELLGVLLLLDTRPETIEIMNLAVQINHRNHGLGEYLVQFSISWAKKHHYHSIKVGTGSTSFAQLYLYQKCGFRVVNIDRNYFVDNYVDPIQENNLTLKDMIRLEKKLMVTSQRRFYEDVIEDNTERLPFGYVGQEEIDAYLDDIE